MRNNIEYRKQQEQNASQILTSNDEMYQLLPYIMQSFPFENPLKLVIQHANFIDSDLNNLLSASGTFPNSYGQIFFERIKEGGEEQIGAIINKGEVLGIASYPRRGREESFLANRRASQEAEGNPLRVTPLVFLTNGSKDKRNLLDIREPLHGEEVNLNGLLRKRNPNFFQVYPRFFTLDGGSHISLLNQCIQTLPQDMMAALTNYFTSKLIALRTLAAISTVHQENDQMVSFAPKSLRFSPGDAVVRFTKEGALVLNAVGFPLGYNKLTNFDGVLHDVLATEEIAYLDAGLFEGPRRFIEKFPQVPEEMKNRKGYVENIIGNTLRVFFQELPDNEILKPFKEKVWKLVENGNSIVPAIVMSAKSPFSVDKIMEYSTPFNRRLPEFEI